MYEAALGCGAFLNGIRIPNLSGSVKLSESLIITEFGATGGGMERVKQRLSQLSALTEHGVHGIRMLGSAAYNLTQVAVGAGQVYFEIGIHAWDIAAGVVLVNEVGGCVVSFEGENLRLNGRSIIATSSKDLLSELIKVIH
jgi:myo-inositol-1(or 4)-monophosphatase